jgi:hypothetical protein
METPARPAFNKRTVTKYVVSHLVAASVGMTVTRLLKNNFPQTENLHIADLAGGLSGWYASSKLQPYTDQIADGVIDALEEHARKNNLQTP